MGAATPELDWPFRDFLSIKNAARDARSSDQNILRGVNSEPDPPTPPHTLSSLTDKVIFVI